MIVYSYYFTSIAVNPTYAAITIASCFAFDKAYGVTDTYTIEFPCRFGVNSDYILQQYKNFAVSEYTMSSQVVSDIKQCFEVLKKASKSFNLASFVFPTGIRLDLMILYAFCRVTDDMIDNEQENKKKLKLKLITKFVDELFAGRKSDYEVETKPYIVPICWSQYESELSDEEMACFRAISRISFYMPRKPFYELIEGYKWDMEGKKVKNEDDLLLYSSYVAGSVGTLCVYIILYKTGDQKLDQKQHEYVIEKAKQMGRVLQIVNISRDIVTDSETLGRCYVPSEYMDDEDEEIKILCEKKTPWELGNKKLKKYAARMIQLANRHRAESLRGIKSLPYEARGPILVATNIYQSVATAVEDSPTYPKRASLNVWNKILVTITSLYFKTLKYCTLSKCRFNY
ncbi:uncharacterized protein LOC126905568 isoform X2 [Daktulosphaira vitifoliae]|uniref:uncharacterized protein LOC126905568 isoform X2 n=1 Tax=Daktulosphaira vitifoliae TaxID=58002 RepID=UPI0021AAF1D8|nr:uncharacterized protein LOC126905568 isoform X2 [Daktulosphaira vitifoliae]